MIHVFYAFIFLALLWEYYQISKAAQAKKIMSFYRDNKKMKRASHSLKGSLYIILAFHFIYSLWAFVGLGTFQWPVFLMIIVLGIIPKNDKPTWYVRFDGIVTAILLIFIFVNKYHLHITLF